MCCGVRQRFVRFSFFYFTFYRVVQMETRDTLAGRATAFRLDCGMSLTQERAAMSADSTHCTMDSEKVPVGFASCTMI